MPSGALRDARNQGAATVGVLGESLAESCSPAPEDKRHGLSELEGMGQTHR